MSDDELRAVVDLSLDDNPAELSDTVTSILNNKTRSFINNTRKEIASSYFTKQDPEADDN
jgi:hypothetical protein